jgi:hypothetical protein
MAFVKGQSGNPAGKAKGTPNAIPHKIRQMCLKVCPEMIEKLKLLSDDPNPAIRLAAINALLDRGIGRAAQPITGADEGPVEVKHIISWIRDDKPEAPVSKEQLTGCAHGHTEDLAWH